ncbi:MAG TPA: prepilin-type N-terminal cleavage/methylation domain-containing protein [Clostridia bacterium]|nr:prepilin-type N-terminal cleavage/methylation domain-containing protein [Clostridia bacterium]
MNTKNIKNILKDTKGLTLIELVAAIAILAIIITPLTMMTVHGISAYYHEQEKIELMETGQFALFKISKQIRLSNSNVSNPSDYEILINETAPYKYKFDDSSKMLKEYINDLPADGNPIAENIKTFKAVISEKLLTIDLQLEGPKYGETVDLKTSIYLRNQ